MSEKIIQHPIIELKPGLWAYRVWKIQHIGPDHFQAVRIRPTEFFFATSMRAAIVSIDRRERDREKLSNSLGEQIH